MNHYETVFILNPVLSETQIEETYKVFGFHTLRWIHHKYRKQGLKKLAYPIQNKKSAFYHLIEFTVDAEAIDAMEVAFRRDERVMRF